MAEKTGTGSPYPDDGEGTERVPNFVPSAWAARYSRWAKKVIDHHACGQARAIEPAAVTWSQAITAVLFGPVLVVILLLFVSMVMVTSAILGVVAFVGCAAPYFWIAWSQRPSS
jgi:hypothetical protein